MVYNVAARASAQDMLVPIFHLLLVGLLLFNMTDVPILGDEALPEARTIVYTKQNITIAPSIPFFGREHLLTCWESHHAFLDHYHRMKIFTDTYGLWEEYNPYFDGIRDTFVVDIREGSLEALRALPSDADVSRVQNFGLMAESSRIHHWNLIRDMCPALKQLHQVFGNSWSYANVGDGQYIRLIEVDRCFGDLPVTDNEYGVRCLKNLNEPAEELRLEFNYYQIEDEEEWGSVKFHVSAMATVSVGDYELYCRAVVHGPSHKFTPTAVAEMWDLNIKPITTNFLEMSFSGDAVLGGRLQSYNVILQTDLDGTLPSVHDGIQELFYLEGDDHPEAKAIRNRSFVEIELPEEEILEEEISEEGVPGEDED